MGYDPNFIPLTKNGFKKHVVCNGFQIWRKPDANRTVYIAYNNLTFSDFSVGIGTADLVDFSAGGDSLVSALEKISTL
jgi:hypothetical protein